MTNLLIPNPYVLTDYINPNDKKKLDDYSEALSKLVALGTHSLSNFWNNGYINLEVDIVIAVFFKRTLDLVDSIAILLKVGSIIPANTQLRTLLELVLTFEYLLKTDTQRRAYSYIITDTHAIIDFADDPKVSPIITTPPALLQAYRNILIDPAYSTIEAEYANKSTTKKNSKRRPKWYNLFSSLSTFKDLANHLNREYYYTILYSHASNFTHGTALLIGAIQSNPNGNLELIGMRQYKEALEMSQTAFQIAKIAFDSMSTCMSKTDYDNYFWHVQILMKQHKAVALPSLV